MPIAIYDTLKWRVVRSRTLARDGSSCTVAGLLGGACSPILHVHHIEPVADGGAPFDLDNLATVCARHHPMWEALRRGIVARRSAPAAEVYCPHHHRSREAREICERRLRRQIAA